MRQKETLCEDRALAGAKIQSTGNNAESNSGCSVFPLYSNAQIEAMKMAMPDLLRSLGITNIEQAFRCLKPEHEDKHPSMHYDPENHRVKCFSCGASGDAIDVAGWVSGETEFPDQVKELEKLTNKDFGEPKNSKVKEHKTKQKQEANIHLLQEGMEQTNYLERVQNAFEALFEPQGQIALNYLHTRGIDEREIGRFGFGWVKHPSEIMKGYENAPSNSSGYLCLPFPSNAEFDAVHYCVFRPLFPTKAKEYKPAGTPAPIYKEYLLHQRGDLYVVEGIFDAVSIDAIYSNLQVSALCGNNSKRMLNALDSTPPANRPNLFLALDNDEAGKKMTDEIAKELDIRSMSFSITPPLPLGCKDANDLLQEIRRRSDASN